MRSVDDEIQFGEVEQASPQEHLRPDRNKHFAVAAYETPVEGELPIFVDLDVLHDMEDHALSDTSVELGGVLLGGQYEDAEGRPFVVITDSLRAEHYESTKGSFKFTHDTWSAITRERDQFPAELAMVGWYHTHPDWGVFLSGMDMFICDNFFNKKLDVAFVIDPCRGDRAMFQWTGDPRQRVKRTGGFFVTASRFRADELQQYVADLSGAAMSTSTSRPAAGSHGAPVVHLHQPAPPPPPPWQGPAIVGVLALQFALLALIAWKLLVPPAAADGQREDKLAAALDKLHDSLAERRTADSAIQQARAQTEVLDHVVAELRGTSDGFVDRLQEKFDHSQRLAADVAARDAQIRELSGSLADVRERLAAEETKAKSERERLSVEVAQLQSAAEKLKKQLDAADTQVAALEAKLDPEKAKPGVVDAAAKDTSVWWYVLGGVLAAAVIVPGVWLAGRMLGSKNPDEPPPPKEQKPTGEQA